MGAAFCGVLFVVGSGLAGMLLCVWGGPGPVGPTGGVSRERLLGERLSQL